MNIETLNKLLDKSIKLLTEVEDKLSNEQQIEFESICNELKYSDKIEE